MKMFLVIFVLGLLIGILIGDAIRKKGTAVGHFYLKPYDEDDTGFYNIFVDIIPNDKNKLNSKSDNQKKKKKEW